MVLVTCVFLLCYGIFLCWGSLFFTGRKCCNDFYYKKTLQVINSGINPKVYVFFKRDIKHEYGRLLFKASLFNSRIYSSDARKTLANVLMNILKTFLRSRGLPVQNLSVTYQFLVKGDLKNFQRPQIALAIYYGLVKYLVFDRITRFLTRISLEIMSVLICAVTYRFFRVI